MHQYPSDISRVEYDLIREDLEGAKKKTRPGKYDLYDVFCAVLYVIQGGIQYTPYSLFYHTYPLLPSFFLESNTYKTGALFLGGVDLYSCVYSDEQTIDHYLRRLGQDRTIYGAVGLSARMYESHPDARISIVEVPSAGLLCEMAGVNRAAR